MNKILLTGGEGFVGSHLIPVLKNYNVTLLRASDVNLSDENSIPNFVDKQKWDIVIHLAGMSHVADCEKDPVKAKLVNVEYTKRLLEAVSEKNPYVHFVFASSAQVYASGVGLTEASEIAPQNVYSQTKWEAERVIREFAESENASATILRFFNHTHKTHAAAFFLPHIYKTLLEMHTKSGPHQIPVGNLDVKRDIGSIHDLTRAISTVIAKQDWDLETFNICSGQAKSLRRLATLLKDRLEVDAEFVVDPSRIRANDPAVMSGSHDKLTKATGWEPKAITEDQLIDDFLAD